MKTFYALTDETTPEVRAAAERVAAKDRAWRQGETAKLADVDTGTLSSRRATGVRAKQRELHNAVLNLREKQGFRPSQPAAWDIASRRDSLLAKVMEDGHLQSCSNAELKTLATLAAPSGEEEPTEDELFRAELIDLELLHRGLIDPPTTGYHNRPADTVPEKTRRQLEDEAIAARAAAAAAEKVRLFLARMPKGTTEEEARRILGL